MIFGNPQWLWAMLLIPLFFGAATLELRRRRRGLQSVVNPKFWSVVIPGIRLRSGSSKLLIWSLALFFLLFALARPKWGEVKEDIHLNGLDLLVVLDVSNSMEVEDIAPNRLKKAKHFLNGVIDQLSGDRVGIVAFAASSYLASPLTTDLNYAKEILSILNPRSVVNQGTDIGLALETAVNALSRGSAAVPSREGPPTQVILLVSDGEDLEQKAIDGIRKVKEKGILFFALGVGTEKGGPIPIKDVQGMVRGYKRMAGEPVLSSFNPSALKSLAEEGGGKYWTITPSETEARELLGAIGGLDKKEYGEKTYVTYKERYQIFLFLALLCLFLERAVRVSKPILMLLFCFYCLGGEARASSLDAYLSNEKGIEALKGGDVNEATRQFGKAQVQEPDSPEISFNQGYLQGKSGQVDNGLKAFRDAEEKAKQNGKENLAARSIFNQGVLSQQSGDLNQAGKSFVQSLEEARRLNDEELEKKALSALNVLVQKQQQKKEQEKKDKDKKKDPSDKNQGSGQGEEKEDKGEKKESKDGKSQEDQEKKDKEDKEGKDKKDQSKAKRNYTRGNPDKFQSEKLSKEDAERIMSDLSNREKQLQHREKRQMGQRNRGGGRDW